MAGVLHRAAVERRALPGPHRGHPDRGDCRVGGVAVGRMAGQAHPPRGGCDAGGVCAGDAGGPALQLPGAQRTCAGQHRPRRGTLAVRDPVERQWCPRGLGGRSRRGHRVCRVRRHRGRLLPATADRRVGPAAAGRRRSRTRGELLRDELVGLPRYPGRVQLPAVDRRAARAGPLAVRRRPMGTGLLDPGRSGRGLAARPRRHQAPWRNRGAGPNPVGLDGRGGDCAARLRARHPHPARPGVDRAVAPRGPGLVGGAGPARPGLVGGRAAGHRLRKQAAPRAAAARAAAVATLRVAPVRRDRGTDRSPRRPVVPGEPVGLRPRHDQPARAVPPHQVREHALPPGAQHLRREPAVRGDGGGGARHARGGLLDGMASPARPGRGPALARPRAARGQPRQQAGLLQPVLARRGPRRGLPGRHARPLRGPDDER